MSVTILLLAAVSVCSSAVIMEDAEECRLWKEVRMQTSIVYIVQVLCHYIMHMHALHIHVHC